MRTKISQHKRVKKKLVPPLATIPFKNQSWKDDRLPEMLWAALLLSGFPRPEALKRIASVVTAAVKGTMPAKDAKPPSGPLPVTLSGMASLSDAVRQRVIASAAADDAGREALRPLLLLASLPARHDWLKVIGKEAVENDGGLLAKAVAQCFDHQSQNATDCRWAKVACAVLSGRAGVSPETVSMIAEYHIHDEEAMRSSRAQIRALEISFAGEWDSAEWPQTFWNDCFEGTACIATPFDEEAWLARYDKDQNIRDRDRLTATNQELTDQFWQTCDSSANDPRHEVAFGIALYASELTTTAILLAMGAAPQGRMTLRALVECLITLRYLHRQVEPSLWSAFIKHGQGQAKLVHQRMQETQRKPAYLSETNLDQIANDDFWTEFVSIEIGHWAGIDLRKMAEDVGLKEVYDDYYTWSSGFTHGQWGAIRESVLELCQNPLHRFHRIPSLVPGSLEDSREDCFKLLAMIIEELKLIYPNTPIQTST